MRNLVRILVASIFVMFMCESNVQAQGLKNVFGKSKKVVNKGVDTVDKSASTV